MALFATPCTCREDLHQPGCRSAPRSGSVLAYDVRRAHTHGDPAAFRIAFTRLVQHLTVGGTLPASWQSAPAERTRAPGLGEANTVYAQLHAIVNSPVSTWDAIADAWMRFDEVMRCGYADTITWPRHDGRPRSATLLDLQDLLPAVHR